MNETSQAECPSAQVFAGSILLRSLQLRLLCVLFLLGLGSCMNKGSDMPLSESWLFKIDTSNVGLKEEWYSTTFEKKNWESVSVPNYWDRYNLGTYDGIGWFATSFVLQDTAEPMALFFGGVDDDADVWVNGVKAGSHVGYSEVFFFDITKLMRSGRNEVVVRVEDHGGPGGIYKPVAIVPLAHTEELLKSPFANHEARKSENWLRDAVIYEVYVRSFSKEGTFKGLEQRLPELKKLGVTVLWLMPIHPVGELNRKGSLGSPYSVQDYYAVNPEFGSLDDFRSLVESARKHDMKIIIDLVANHTSWDSKLMFEYPEWFTHDDTGAIVAPNADWTDVADLNYDHHELRKYMIEAMKFWIRDIGIDGYRCDVAELVPTDFWNIARGELEKIKPVMMLSEGTLPEHHVRAFDVTYAWSTYDVLSRIFSGSTPVSVVHEIIRNEAYQFPKGSLRLRFNTNHDKNAWDAPAVEKFGRAGAKLTAVFMYTLPGIPLLYNGEEAGNEKRLLLYDRVEIDWGRNRDFRTFYQRLGALRASSDALRRGTYEPIDNSDNVKVLSFMRTLGTEKVLTILNFSNMKKEVQVDGGVDSRWKEFFGNRVVGTKHGRLAVTLSAHEYNVFILQSE